MHQACRAAIIQVESEIARVGDGDIAPPGKWSKAEILKICAIYAVCGKRWSLIAEMLGNRPFSSVRYQVLKAEVRRSERCADGLEPPTSILMPIHFAPEKDNGIRKHPTSVLSVSDIAKRAEAISAMEKVEKDFGGPGLPDFHAPVAWTKMQVLKLIAVAPILGSRWVIMEELLGLSEKQKLRHFYRFAEARRAERVGAGAVGFPLIPEDFSDKRNKGGCAGTSANIEKMWALAQAASTEIDVHMKRNGINPMVQKPNGWTEGEIRKVIAMAPICGNHWKIMADVIGTRTPANIQWQVTRAEEMRSVRCSSSFPDITSPLLVEDFLCRRGTIKAGIIGEWVNNS